MHTAKQEREREPGYPATSSLGSRQKEIDRFQGNGHKAMMRFEDQNPDEIAQKLAHIAWEAGRVLRAMESAFLDKRIKDDGTPTTAADRRSSSSRTGPASDGGTPAIPASPRVASR